MVSQEDFNVISKLLNYKGNTNIKGKITDQISNIILNHDSEEETPGIRVRFLEFKKQDLPGGTWNEYNVLIEADKYQDTPRYLEYIFKSISKIIRKITMVNGIDSIGIQEVNLSEPNAYYFLIYIISNGKDKNKETEI